MYPHSTSILRVSTPLYMLQVLPVASVGWPRALSGLPAYHCECQRVHFVPILVCLVLCSFGLVSDIWSACILHLYTHLVGSGPLSGCMVAPSLYYHPAATPTAMAGLRNGCFLHYYSHPIGGGGWSSMLDLGTGTLWPTLREWHLDHFWCLSRWWPHSHPRYFYQVGSLKKVI